MNQAVGPSSEGAAHDAPLFLFRSNRRALQAKLVIRSDVRGDANWCDELYEPEEPVPLHVGTSLPVPSSLRSSDDIEGLVHVGDTSPDSNADDSMTCRPDELDDHRTGDSADV